MNSTVTKIFIFTLPQEIIINEAEKKLVCNIVIMPKFDPTKPLMAGAVSFAKSNIQLNAFLVKGNELVPALETHTDSYATVETVLDPVNPDRTALFEEIGTYFKIQDEHGREPIIAIPIKKYLPESYRKAFGFAGTRQGAVSDDSYFCALKENSFKNIDVANKDIVNWAQVMAFCLHQPKLATQMGILYEKVEMELPSSDYFKDGGWVYVDFKVGSSFKDLLPENIQRYSAWIPPVTESRNLFSPVLFPVEEPEAAGPFDAIFDDVLHYSDGFAKIVHSSQPISTDHLGEEASGTAPVTDMGIRLAWDDEQVLEWYNRGLQSQANIVAGNKADTPLVVSKYRIDVAQINPEDISLNSAQLEEKLKDTWKSQVSLTSTNLKTGDIDLGKVDMESGVSVSFAKHGDNGSYWLPAYFTNWNGTCLCIPDPLPEKLNQLDVIKDEMMRNKNENPDDLPKALYTHPKEDQLDLKYGNVYAFRVRLSDISGGGPGPKSNSQNKGEHKIAVQKFKRYVAPQPPTIKIAKDGNSLVIERPRLNYPAVLYTNVDTKKATDELLEDRKELIALRNRDDATRNFHTWLREVSLPDPDVAQVEIVVEINTLDMDREDSYHAITGTTPKEAYVFLYKTFRDFPKYILKHNHPKDVIDLKLDYQDIPVINFLAPDKKFGLVGKINSKKGPLLLPTARDIRITIRSFCPNETSEYFGSEDSRISIPTVQFLRQDPKKLEKEPLLDEPIDSLLSMFFQPQPIITPQFRKEQKTRGKGNATDSDLLDRLAAITSLTHKTGSLTGKDNVRTQMGCSKIINHSVSPDRSSITFASRDDFYHKWINVIQLDLNRDWTWDMLKPDSFKVFRHWKFEGNEDFQEKEELGIIGLTKGLNWQAMNEPNRSFTKLVFIDALDPKPSEGNFPEPIEVRYFIEPQFKQVIKNDVPIEFGFDESSTVKQLTNLLPITTVPAQVPKIVAVGIALSPESPEEELIANRYSETFNRNRYLWVEFDKPLVDNQDMYFARVLSYSPDPMLAALDERLEGTILSDGFLRDGNNPNWTKENWQAYLRNEQPEPPINLDPETVRIVRPGQPFDQSGLDAMQAMIPANAVVPDEKPTHFLLPLPPGVYQDSEELFGFFTYEFRVGHADPKKWSTAQGRYGSPLRVTGVQHPAPSMIVHTMRDRGKILVSTRHAQSFFEGRNVTPSKPRTDIHACLYAQVIQADGVQYRNILLDKLLLLKPFLTLDLDEVEAYNRRKMEKENPEKPFSPPESPVLLAGTPPYSVGFWNMKNIREKLRFLGIDENAPLSVLSIELMPRNDFHNGEIPDSNFSIHPLSPQEVLLDKIRILRTSKLCPVMETCLLEI
ncbi:hypothetical protein LX77_01083 [Gelidibacter algens]|uniref:Uncharacterized protein n=2 Tax=Gelidibacter algens TaxID=49280 RepID=A0A1A7R442_9FLAO|nr:hypothetical protein A9996_03370 [Gelidibacter algens]RAJ25668.1 hypothetical protein LX77_01083 [Gelidibacter algens]